MKESIILNRWHLVVMILIGILTPAVTVTGAYWNMKLDIERTKDQISERVSQVELKSEQNFANKESLQGLTEEVKVMHDDVLEIKTILLSKKR